LKRPIVGHAEIRTKVDYIDYEPLFPLGYLRVGPVFEYAALLGKNVHRMTTPLKRPLLVLLAAIALFAGACTGDENPSSGEKTPQQEEGKGQPQEEGPSGASFSIAELKVIDSQDRPEAGAKAEEQRDKVLALINGYYNVAFLDPGKWAEGTHPELAGFFTEEAKPNVGPRLGVLALGDVSKSIKSVKPDRQVVDRLNIYFDGDLNVPIGLATTTFEATGTPLADGAEPVKIVHKATFWLQKDGDNFHISAFNADIDMQSQGAA
jgi:hypothetical protein